MALFERDAYLRECEAEVVGSGREGDRPWVLLSQTILFPAGGGQPADRGWINGVDVLDVARVAGNIRHFVAHPIDSGPAHVTLDWPRRFDLMQQHSAQHLLTAVAQDRFGWPTTAFHLGDEVSDVELAVPSLTREQLDTLEAAVVEEIRAARPVSCRTVTREAFKDLAGVRTRGLPEDHAGDVRLVEIAGVDCNTCGGTHVRSTAEVETLALLRTEPMRGGTRVHFVAGGRLRRRLAGHEARTAELRSLLGAPDHELAAAVAARIESQRLHEKQLRAAEDELAEAVARELASGAATLADAHFEGRSISFLQQVGRACASAAPASVVFLTADGTAGACFLLAAGESCAADVQSLGRQVAALIDGRGGGSGRLFQGKAGTLRRRGEAIEILRRAVEAP